MKNHFLLFTLLFYVSQLGAQTMLPGNDCIAHRNGKKVILRDSTQLFQTFVMRDGAGADEFRLLPDGSREYVTTHHYATPVNDPGKYIPLSGQTIRSIPAFRSPTGTP
jgi:hypothetical protein